MVDASVSIDRRLTLAAGEDPYAPFVTFGTNGVPVTRAELNEGAGALAEGLRGLGVGPGDRVAMMLGNRVEFLETVFAVVRLGAIVVPMNVSLRGDSLRYVLDQTEPRLVVTDAARLPNLRSGIDACAVLVACVDPESSPDPHVIAFDALRGSAMAGTGGREPGDPFAIMYTSGTTGPPKGVVWSHGMALKVARTAQQNMGYRSDDVVFTALPLFHGNGLALSVFAALLAGARAAVMPDFSAQRFWHQVVASGATTVNLLGSMAQILWLRAPSEAEQKHRLRTALVIPSPAPEQYEQFERRFSLRMVEAYGLTDVGMLTWTPDGERRPGSCGRVCAGWECRLVDEHGLPVAAGEAGELVARPTEPHIAPLGYWRMPEATVESWRDLWIHTGDVLTEDRGWFRFVGRRKDAIRRRGENVSAFEVERSLLSHPAVEDCAVYALPSELGEDEVAAAVVLSRADPPSDAEDLVRHCEASLPYFAVPRYVRVLDALPKTATEKVLKGDLAAAGVTAETWDRDRAGYQLAR